MQIFIKLLGKTIKLECKLDETVAYLKNKIYYREKYPICVQNLLFEGNCLFNNNLLNYYNIQKNSTLHLVMRSRRGMHFITSASEEINKLADEVISIEIQILNTNKLYIYDLPSLTPIKNLLNQMELDNFIKKMIIK
jgi:ubiquitin-large subunit ribosomal protein L40e